MAEVESRQRRLPESDPTIYNLAAARSDRHAAASADKKSSFSASDFHGSWDVRRTIIDHLSGAVHRFVGTAIIAAFDFVETGEVRYGDVFLKGERRYVLRDGTFDIAHGGAKGSAQGIAFADGRPFISLEREASQAVQHLCGADDYRGQFFFRTRDAWVEAWRVTGPRKRYASLTHYRRQVV